MSDSLGRQVVNLGELIIEVKKFISLPKISREQLVWTDQTRNGSSVKTTPFVQLIGRGMSGYLTVEEIKDIVESEIEKIKRDCDNYLELLRKFSNTRKKFR